MPVKKRFPMSMVVKERKTAASCFFTGEMIVTVEGVPSTPASSGFILLLSFAMSAGEAPMVRSLPLRNSIPPPLSTTPTVAFTIPLWFSSFSTRAKNFSLLITVSSDNSCASSTDSSFTLFM